MEDITGFRRDILYVVAGFSDPTGSQIREELERYYGADVLDARVYQNLDALADADLIEKGVRDSRTNYYRLTGTGCECIEARRRWERGYFDATSGR